MLFNVFYADVSDVESGRLNNVGLFGAGSHSDHFEIKAALMGGCRHTGMYD